MQTKMTPADRLSELVSNNNIPVTALFDVKSRMNDWLASGGKLNDEYMWQQVRYIENIAKRMEELGGSL
ncbi:DUF6877 family protein [Latilactobacillus curvatus]